MLTSGHINPVFAIEKHLNAGIEDVYHKGSKVLAILAEPRYRILTRIFTDKHPNYDYHINNVWELPSKNGWLAWDDQVYNCFSKIETTSDLGNKEGNRLNWVVVKIV